MLQKNKRNYNDSNIRNVQKTFTDGICSIYTATERLITNLKGSFYFSNESIGYGHYWEAYNNNVSLDRAISIPYCNLVFDTQDIVVIGNDKYTISRIQYHDDKRPFYWTLTLSKAQFSYEVSL